MADKVDLTGRVIGGTYRIDGKLGEGGMGAVYRATDTRLDRPVALKVLRAHLAADEDFARRFQREAKAAARFKHPHIVDVYAFGEDQGLLFLALELIEGGDLAQRIATGGQQPIPFATTVVLQVLSALEVAHAQGVVHRDLKPQNLMLSGDRERPHVKILDFGIAKMREADAQGALTRTGTVMGTLAYMAPEQAGGEAIDGRADLYSVGIILYEMLTGELPFKGSTGMELMKKQMLEPPPPPRSKRPDLAPELERVLLRALAKTPQERFPDARAFGDALRALPGAAPATGTFAPTVVETPARGSVATAEAFAATERLPTAARPAAPAAPPSSGRTIAYGLVVGALLGFCALSAFVLYVLDELFG